ncbi:MAG: hypothetical protein Q8R47_01465 [Nanoarchaeota archaeon]|nr:hypothetical protein [Nanoarchaeota archaeon]
MDSLDLHLEGEVILPYKRYDGNIQEILRQLRSEHRSPLSVFHFINRLKEVEVDAMVSEKWKNPLTLGGAMARHPYESAKIMCGNPELWDYLAKSKLRDGVVELCGTAYDNLAGLHVPGFRVIQNSVHEQGIFSYLGLEEPTERRILFPKVKDYPYITLLAFSHSAKILGTSRLDENGSLIGIR